MNLEWFLRHGKHQVFAGVGALTRLYRPMQLKLVSLAALLGEPGLTGSLDVRWHAGCAC